MFQKVEEDLPWCGGPERPQQRHHGPRSGEKLRAGILPAFGQTCSSVQ